jgi:hypothetical protein
MNFLDSLFFFNQIFNPISFTISSIEEKDYTFKTYNDYINEIDKNKSLVKPDLKTLLNKIIYRNPAKSNNSEYNQTITKLIDFAAGNYTEIENIKIDILGDVVNFAVLAVFLIVAAMLTFALRNYNDDWRSDMRIYFLVKNFFIYNFLFIFLCFFLFIFT